MVLTCSYPPINDAYYKHILKLDKHLIISKSPDCPLRAILIVLPNKETWHKMIIVFFIIILSIEKFDVMLSIDHLYNNIVMMREK